MTRLNRSAQRRVFRRKRRIPVGMVIRQLIVILLLLSGGIGIVVLLQRLPEQVDLMVLVSPVSYTHLTLPTMRTV